MELIAENITKYFDEKQILSNISFYIGKRQCLLISGPNGSGKTTLMRILSCLTLPTEGKVIYRLNGSELKREAIFQYISLVGPYLELYQDLSAWENLSFFARMKNIDNYQDKIDGLMKKLNLAGREGDLVKTYSSGMKQRLKYVFALLSDPGVLFVDEPRSNLDEQGIRIIYELLEKQKNKGILVIATNDSEDLKFADQTVHVDA